LEVRVAVVDEIREANSSYASVFEKGELPGPPRRKFAVVTCMDARLDPAKFLGLDEGDAHVIRNAGGTVTDDALRSLVISHHLLGTEEALVIAHTRCGMLSFKDEELQERLGTDMPFHAFPDLEESVRTSLRTIREAPELPASFEARGFVYEVETGRLRDVA
jgi:carbonic anhydrase